MMLYLNVRHFCAGATLDRHGYIIAPYAPILHGWRGKYWKDVVAYYERKWQLIEAKVI